VSAEEVVKCEEKYAKAKAVSSDFGIHVIFITYLPLHVENSLAFQ